MKKKKTKKKIKSHARAVKSTGSGEIYSLSGSGNENYCANASILLVRPNCVVIFVARS